MKVGDDVIVGTLPDNVPWKEIEGRQGVIVAIDILGNVHVQIAGYPNPFVLDVEDLQKVSSDDLTR